MNAAKHIFVGLAIATQAFAVSAADQEKGDGSNVDTSKWVCKFCPFEEGYSGEVEAGLGNISDAELKFGRFTGVEDEGLFFVGNGTLRYRGEDAKYWDVTATDLGLRSRSLSAEGGRQGAYRLFLGYDQIPRFISGTAVTPYLGVGGDTLILPTGWVPAGTTGGMTALPATLREVDISHERQRVDIGAAFMPTRNWEYAAKYRREMKEGTKTIGGSFMLQSVILPEPIDYVTDQVDLTASYAGKSWQAQLGYSGSFFRNEHPFLTWQNPFTPLVPGADAGQLALPPDNQFHQLNFSLGHHFTQATRAVASIAVGRMTQDENFAPYTLNPNVDPGASPRDSLDGRIDTLTGSLRVTSSATDRLRLTAAYRYNERDNETPQATFTPVITDLFVSVPRTNIPYSFEQNIAELEADYRIARRANLAVGAEQERFRRPLQEIEKTTENTLWGRLRFQPWDRLGLMLKLAHAERDGSALNPVAEVIPPQNPLLVKYNMADRDRDSVGVSVSFTPHQRINFELGASYAADDYFNSVLGLRDSKSVTYTADASFLAAENMNFHAFLAREQYDSNQAGSQTFSTPDWFADNEDVVDTAGIGVMFTALANKLETGLDYVYSRSRGEITVTTSGLASEFPDLKTELHGVRLYAEYRKSDALSIRLGYFYERYRLDDWTVENVAPTTIPNVLTLGEPELSYSGNAVALSARYRF